MIKNSNEKYGIISKTIHWTITSLFLYMFYLASTMMGMEDSADKWAMYGEHKQFGVLVFILVLFRIGWIVANKNPEYPQKNSKWKKFLAKATHIFLYLIMLAFPISGYLMSMAGGHGISFFGMGVYDLVGKSESLGELSHTIHSALEYITYAIVGLHVMGALYHHIIENDNVLTRMLPFGK
jgi:cytochrome b561